MMVTRAARLGLLIPDHQAEAVLGAQILQPTTDRDFGQNHVFYSVRTIKMKKLGSDDITALLGKLSSRLANAPPNAAAAPKDID